MLVGAMLGCSTPSCRTRTSGQWLTSEECHQTCPNHEICTLSPHCRYAAWGKAYYVSCFWFAWSMGNFHHYVHLLAASGVLLDRLPACLGGWCQKLKVSFPDSECWNINHTDSAQSPVCQHCLCYINHQMAAQLWSPHRIQGLQSQQSMVCLV